MSFEVELVLMIPIVTAILCRAVPDKRRSSAISAAGLLVGLLATANLCVPVFLEGGVVEYGPWYVDGLSSLFIMLTSFVAFMVTMYSGRYLGFEREEHTLTTISEKNYFLSLNLLVAVMLSVFMVSSLGLMWILIEATTLISSFLVGFYRNEHSIEAAWKYLVLCSVGITLALVGISLVYASIAGMISDSGSALDWPVLMSAAADLDPALLKTAMVFIIVGFGTKMGLVPMHTWLPDAHSQAPSPISALLSAAMLNCALFCIMRFYIISGICIPGFAQTLLLVFGFLSVIVAAAFIVISKNIKRMLAYSSIENMGIIAIGLGIGTDLSIFAALFMVMAHSLTKPILFFAAGNITQEYGTKDMPSIKGLRAGMPFTSSVLVIGTLAILGMPVFSIFVGEIAILHAAMSSGMWWIAVILTVAIIVIFAGFMMHIFPMLGGTPDKEVHEPKGIVGSVPFVILIGLTAFFGIFMPESILNGFDLIVENVFGGML